MQRYFKIAPIELPQLLRASYLLILIAGTIVSLGILISGPGLTRLTSLPISWILVANACAMLSMVQTIGLTLLQMRQQASRYGTNQVLGTSSNFAFSILLVVYLEYGWQGRIEGILISLLITGGWLVFQQWKDGDLNFNLDNPQDPAAEIVNLGDTMKDLLSRGILLVPGAMAVWGTTMIDRFFINTQADGKALGIYSVGIMFAQVVEVICSAISQAFFPVILSKLNGTEQDRHKLVFQIYFLIVLYILISLVWSVVGSLLLTSRLIDERYHGAASVLLLLAFGYAFINANSLVSSLILNREKNALVSAITLFPFLLSVCMNFFLVPAYGITGAAWAFAISMAMNFTLSLVAACRVVDLPWFSFRLAKY